MGRSRKNQFFSAKAVDLMSPTAPLFGADGFSLRRAERKIACRCYSKDRAPAAGQLPIHHRILPGERASVACAIRRSGSKQAFRLCGMGVNQDEVGRRPLTALIDVSKARVRSGRSGGGERRVRIDPPRHMKNTTAT